MGMVTSSSSSLYRRKKWGMEEMALSSVVDYVIVQNYILSFPMEFLFIGSSLPDNFLIIHVPLTSSLVTWFSSSNKMWMEVILTASKKNLEYPFYLFLSVEDTLSVQIPAWRGTEQIYGSYPPCACNKNKKSLLWYCKPLRNGAIC